MEPPMPVLVAHTSAATPPKGRRMAPDYADSVARVIPWVRGRIRT